MASILLAYVEPKLFLSFAGKFSVKLNKEERIHGNPSHFTKKMDIPIMSRDYWPSSVFAKTDEK